MHDWKSEFDFSVKIMELKRYSVLNPVEVTFMYIYLCTDFLIYFSYSFIYRFFYLYLYLYLLLFYN